MCEMAQLKQAVRGILPTAVLVLALAAAPAPGAIIDGLQAYWGFEGNGDDGIGAVDLAAVDDGSTIGYVPGLIGQALSVPRNVGGGGSYVESSAPAGDHNIDKELTISLWYKQTVAAVGATTYLFAQPGYLGLSMYTSGSRKGFGTVDRVGAGSVFTTIPAGFEGANVWQHRVFRVSNIAHLSQEWYARATADDHGTFDAQVTLYRDPEIDGTIPVRMAWNKNPGSDYQFDEVAIWNRALSDVEIEQLFDMGKAGTPIPEPASILMLGGGLAALAARKRDRR